MVKPPKTMQPEAVDLKKSGRDASKSFQEDSFRNYMARKIDLQRRQFGVVLPPPSKEVRFASDMKEEPLKKKRKRTGISAVLKRLKRRHGRKSKKRNRESSSSRETERDDERTSNEEETMDAGATMDSSSLVDDENDTVDAVNTPQTAITSGDSAQLPSTALPLELKKSRPDLFFLGVVVLVNGYTNPDTETLQRLLHKYGGDLEKYETSRVTHIVAEHLSTAKANIYKRQRRPLPVCHPSWIVDSVKAQRLLPHATYLIEEVRDSNQGIQSVASFFSNPQKTNVDDSNRDAPCKEVEKSVSEDSQSKPATLKKPKANPLRSNDAEMGAEDRQAAPESKEISLPAPRKPASEGAEIVLAAQNDRQQAVDSHVQPARDSHTTKSSGRTDDKYIDGRIRTVGTDPNFLESFFQSSRLSFIGSYKQRARQSPLKKATARVGGRRFVFHIDMDCFFASVVLRNFPEFRDKPVAISHHGQRSTDSGPVLPISRDSTSECATCNYHARKYGIKKGMYLGRAKTLCPDLIVLHYDFEGYEEVSEQVADILFRHAAEHDGVVEQVSCDEAYMQIQVYNDETDMLPEKLSADIAETIRKEIFESTQCTATVGVASNKLLAKLATDHAKPNKSFVVDDYRELMKDLELRDLHGIGYRLDRKLAAEGLTTVQDVWDSGTDGERELCRILGPGVGHKIASFCRGVDDRPVQPAERKTIGAECNYGVRFNGPYGVEHMIEGLAKEVEKRMENVGVKGSKITLKVKQRKQGAPPPPKFLGHGSCHNLSKCLDTPNGTATRDWKAMSRVCKSMFADLGVSKEDVRGMGITVSKLDKDLSSGTAESDTRQCITSYFSAKAGVEDLRSSNSRNSGQDTLNGEEIYDMVDAFKMEILDGLGAPVEDTGVAADPDEECQVVGVGGTCTESHFDIALPPLSQIHMSQVEVLPSPIRKHIVSKIVHEKSRQVRPSTRESKKKDSCSKQPDVDRMFRLGNQRSETKQTTNVEHANSTAVAEFKLDSSDSRLFFRENVLPLSVFMDEDPETSNEAICHVKDFLFLLIDDNRLSDVVVLLRSIHNRDDSWSKKAFDSILEAVNARIGGTQDSTLDIDGLFPSRICPELT